MCIFDTLDLKNKYPDAEIGIMIYNFKQRCGEHDFGEEFYIYVSKTGFNKNNSDIILHYGF